MDALLLSGLGRDALKDEAHQVDQQHQQQDDGDDLENGDPVDADRLPHAVHLAERPRPGGTQAVAGRVGQEEQDGGVGDDQEQHQRDGKVNDTLPAGGREECAE